MFADSLYIPTAQGAQVVIKMKNKEYKNTIEIDQFIDITGELCPMTFVKTKLKIEKMASGEVLEVQLRGEEPLENVPRSVRDHGHEVLLLEEVNGAVLEPQQSGPIYRLFIRKA